MHLKINNTYLVNESLYITYKYKVIENVSLNLEMDPPNFIKTDFIKVTFSFYLHETKLPREESARIFERKEIFDIEKNKQFLEENGMDPIKIAESLLSLSVSKDSSNKNVARLRKLATVLNEILKVKPQSEYLIPTNVNKAKCKKTVSELLQKLVTKGTLQDDNE